MERKRSIFGPLLLIGIGVIWLLVKAGTVPAENLWALTHIWPFLLIAAGLGLIIKPYWSGISIVLDILIIGGLFTAIYFAPQFGWDNPWLVAFGQDGELFSGPSVRGSGHVISETRKVSDFNNIKLDYPANVVVTQGNKESLQIEAEDNLLPGLKTEVTDGDLHIYYKSVDGKYVNTTEPVKITITVTDLKGIALSSAGELDLNNIQSDELAISLDGAGSIKLKDIDIKALAINFSGAGSLIASGTADNLSLNISGFGDFDGKDLNSKIVTVNISGAGGATVWAEEELTATISGAGSVNFYGSPAVTKNINGVGNVNHLDK